MPLASLIALACAALLLVLVLQDAFEVMLLPRRVKRRVRLMRLFFRFTWWIWTAIARTQSARDRRERFLSIYGALSMVLLFALWAVALVLAFGLLQWGVDARDAWSGLGEQIYMSGATFFTLGYGDVVPHSNLGRLIAVTEAGVGIGFIAVVIGYLPVLYQLFSRREAFVIQLDGRAGSPPTAGVMLRRHAESDSLDRLETLLALWETWGAELLESHLSYPMLVYYRSQHADQSWLAALAAVMDASALVLVGVEDLKPLQARMTFTMGRQVLIEMARYFAVDHIAADDRLDHETYLRLEDQLEKAGVTWTRGEESEELLRALRLTYEPFLAGLAGYLLIDLPPWIPDDDTPDHWERGHRGMMARRLIDGLASRTPPTAGRPSKGDTPAKRLRERLCRR